MSFATKHNKGGIDWGIPTIENMTFIKPEEAFKKYKPETVYPVNGLYINKKGNFGDHGVIIDARDNLLFDAPQHMTEEIKNILGDQEDIADIKAGKVGFVIEPYKDSNNVDRYGIKWVDME